MRKVIAIAIVLALGALTAASISAGAGGAAARPGGAAPRTITLVNRTDQTIWPAAWPGSTSGQTGWTLAPGASTSFTVPHDWNARLWGRTGCHFGPGAGGSCRTGDCDGRYQCRGWGTIPATLAEYDMDSYKGLDFYDISMVDGSNLPMYATPTSGEATKKVSLDGCLGAGRCTTEVHCPAALRVPRHGGREVGCISPCARFGTNRYCCRGPFAAGCSPAKTWPVDYAQVFKRAEPYAYSWSGDDATSVFTCKGNCDYTITFGVTAGADQAAPGASAARRAGPNERHLFHKRHISLPPTTEVTMKAPASNGYRLSASVRRINFSPAELEKFSSPTPASFTTFLFELNRGGAKVQYVPKATFSGDKLKARLENLGVAALTFHPRRVTTEPVEKGCHGAPTLIEHGVLEGVLRFRGELGYTSVRRRQIPATLTRRRRWKCDLTPTAGKQPAGVRVGGDARHGRTYVGFTATRTGPAGAGSFTAYLDERNRRMSIQRVLAATGAAGSVAIEPDLSAATVEPPAPFRGTASFVADRGKQTGSWLGPLAASFPGRPNVRLAGGRFEGSVLKDGQCSPDPHVECFGISARR